MVFCFAANLNNSNQETLATPQAKQITTSLKCSAEKWKSFITAGTSRTRLSITATPDRTKRRESFFSFSMEKMDLVQERLVKISPRLEITSVVKVKALTSPSGFFRKIAVKYTAQMISKILFQYPPKLSFLILATLPIPQYGLYPFYLLIDPFL